MIRKASGWFESHHLMWNDTKCLLVSDPQHIEDVMWNSSINTHEVCDMYGTTHVAEDLRLTKVGAEITNLTDRRSDM